ncbi:MAG: hypothetical protein L3J46_09150, partial [Kangiellaceae bacterium]|nr:hypothetical protein [Kangiellaceae bacterium]
MKNTISKLKVIMREWQTKLIDDDHYQLSHDETSSIRAKLSPLLAEIFGYHALLYSANAKKLVDENLSVRHSFILANASQTNIKNELHTILCHYTKLP